MLTSDIEIALFRIDPNYDIEFPPLENPFLLETLRGCLRRDPKRRMTIPDLLNHPFLHPDKVITRLLEQLSTATNKQT
jgi:serine/threonine-protein kinase TTK/MPS1